jgi:hypothetical protein
LGANPQQDFPSHQALHQHGFRTFLGGKYDLLLTAVRGGDRGRDAGSGSRACGRGRYRGPTRYLQPYTEGGGED